MLAQLSGSRAMPEFDVGLLTIRSGTRLVRIMADDSLTARCTPLLDWCTWVSYSWFGTPPPGSTAACAASVQTSQARE
jgi:hypothetical protein